MKTLARERSKVEILTRLGELRPDSPRRWGRMSAHQMVCHLADSCRMAMGERLVSPATGLLQRSVIKWMVLYGPLTWPSGVLTRPEIDQAAGGTCPADFTADVAGLAGLVELIATRRRNFPWPSHPIFGRLSHAEWLRWAYLHADHHLRQFGV